MIKKYSKSLATMSHWYSKNALNAIVSWNFTEIHTGFYLKQLSSQTDSLFYAALNWLDCSLSSFVSLIKQRDSLKQFHNSWFSVEQSD